jgi:2-polyprenyl-3-methyl-5-hydroxy-6-metoxy-1,4-benzoquinol methylase
MTESLYTDGSYRALNPEWHSADSGWKAERIAAMLTANSVDFDSCVEVGCGAGQVLAGLAQRIPGKRYTGYEISADAAALWRSLPPTVSYRTGDFIASGESYDLLLLIDVFEHVEDYMSFLRKLSTRARWFVFHIPLEMHVSALLRDRQLHARAQVGHLHYFSRATALATLADTGYRITSAEYTNLAQETQEGRRTLTRLANLVRAGAQAISRDLAAKLLGGYSLLVLCRSAAEAQRAAARTMAPATG